MSDTHAQIEVLVEGMRAAIHNFKEGKLSIDRLAWDLKSRIAVLRQVANEAWADELKAIWNQLEVVNAFFIESGRKDLNADEGKEVEEIIDELLAALVAYLRDDEALRERWMESQGVSGWLG
jgi:hypothetical protein